MKTSMTNSWPQLQRFESLNRALDEMLALSADEREPVLAQWRIENPDEAPLLERLLEAADSDSYHIDSVLECAVARSVVGMTADSDQQLGDWQLTQWLGRGGMAEVWLASGSGTHRDQRAAIKCLSPGLATPEFIARFEQERRILATLDDPHIARLLDGGVTADGRPWLAMEYVAGERIDAWCDARQLDLTARVRLLREVAIAVHSAHRALIVHRDIKPANVMVTTEGHVKLLDSENETASDKSTQTRSRVLTPQYASPEQFLGATVTTAVDVYQLGLLMVELLCGVRPFQSRSENLVKLAHAVVSEDAPPPSQALNRAALASAEIERVLNARRTTAKRLRRQLRGDLDAIAQCAMARVPEQRYASAMQFADDLDAWLAQRTVRARAPSLGYRVRRFVSRNWLASAAAAALVVVLAAYIGTVLVQSERIRREAELNRLVRDYLVELLREADPRFTRTPQASAERVLEQGLLRARERFSAQPDLLAELLDIGGQVQVGRGDMPRAADLIGEALALRRGLDPDDPQLTAVLGEYGRALHYSGRYTQAEAALREAESRWYAQGAFGTAWIPMALSDVLHSRGEYVIAQAVLRRADAAQRASAAPPAAHAELARDLGTVLRDSGHIAEARTLQRAALTQLLKMYGDANATTAATQTALAQTLVLDGEAAEARLLINTAIATQRQHYGEHHAVIGISRHTLALVDELDGQFDAALRGLDDVLADNYASIAPGNVLPAYAFLDRAWLHMIVNHDQDAARDLDAAEAILWPIRDGGHPRWSALQLARAVLAVRRGDTQSARTAIGRAIAQREAQLGADNTFTLEARRWLQTLDRGTAPAPAANAPRLEAVRLRLLLPSTIDPA